MCLHGSYESARIGLDLTLRQRPRPLVITHSLRRFHTVVGARPNGLVPALERRLVRECTLTADLGAAQLARDFTRAALPAWSHEDLFESITLVASELVTNAVRYATPQGVRADADPVIRLGLVREAAFILCMVHDCGSTAPDAEDVAGLAGADPLDEVGRGLRIVAQLSTTWGWTRPDHSGKTVWAIFATADRFDHADEFAGPAAPLRDQPPTLHTTPRTASPCQRATLDAAWRRDGWRRNRLLDDVRPA